MTAGLNVAGLLELALLLVAVGALSGFLSPAYSASAAARSRRRYFMNASVASRLADQFAVTMPGAGPAAIYGKTKPTR
jgi:hypothetical protein